MPTRSPLVLSQSSIQDYADCPRRFQLHYLDHLVYPAMESEPALENERKQQEGELFHRLVQQSLLGMDNEKLSRLANTPNLSRWWRNFIEHGPSLEGCMLYPEYSLSAPAGSFRIVAKYDLIAIKAEKVLIYDWKTFARQPRRDWLAARWQTRIYPALLSRSSGFLIGKESIPPQNIKMHYWLSEFPEETVAFDYSAEQFRRDWDAIQTVANEILTVQEFIKTEDLPKCKFCTYRSYCGRGEAAGLESDRDMESEMQAFSDIDFEQIGEIAF